MALLGRAQRCASLVGLRVPVDEDETVSRHHSHNGVDVEAWQLERWHGLPVDQFESHADCARTRELRDVGAQVRDCALLTRSGRGGHAESGTRPKAHCTACRVSPIKRMKRDQQGSRFLD